MVVIQTSDKGKKTISGIGKNASQSLQRNEIAINPFSHPRVLFNDFYIAEKLLQHAFRKLSNIGFWRPKPKVILHPMEKIEGGLTMIEKRAFRELALGAGASDIKLYTGSPLNVSAIDFDKFNQYEDNEHRISQQGVANNTAVSSVGLFLFYLTLVIIALWYFRQ
ncbi:rod shape-determining protein MreB [Aliiglaciecola litoralis]